MKEKIEIKILETADSISNKEKELIADFLFEHLEQYGDPKNDILKSIDYVTNSFYGGKIILAEQSKEICGAVVLNNTGMEGYIPENSLVYIAVNKKFRGQGIGKLLMKKAIEITKGDIALLVEEGNPARFLYEKVGFSKKYAEMRFIRQ